MDEPECLLLVEDEPDVRASFRAWLERLNPQPRILEADSAHDALELVNKHSIDLVILDWNLGDGINGLELLTSLKVFQPEIVAILVTGYAGLATPLQALRLGVRDYLDKHAGLDESTFLGAVQNQLEGLRPRKRELQVQRELHAFRESVSMALPWLRHSSELKPRPEPNAASQTAMLRLLAAAFESESATLISWPSEQGGPCEIIDSDGGSFEEILETEAEGSAARLCLSSGEPILLRDLPRAEQIGELRLAGWEKLKKPQNVLAIPIVSQSGRQSALCLYQGNPGDSPANLGTRANALAGLVQAALGPYPLHRQESTSAKQWMAALEDALKKAERLGNSLKNRQKNSSLPQNTLVEAVRADLEKCWQDLLPSGTGEAITHLLGAITDLAKEFGTPALDHTLRLVQETKRLLGHLQTEGGPEFPAGAGR